MHKALSNILQRLLSRLLPTIAQRIKRPYAPLSIPVSREISIDEELFALPGVAEIGELRLVEKGFVNVVGEVDFLVLPGVEGSLALSVPVLSDWIGGLVLSIVSVSTMGCWIEGEKGEGTHALELWVP